MERKRSATKYWVEINGSLYARLQYKNDSGKRRVKYRSITDKRKARSVVEALRRELDTHGEEMFNAEKLTFNQFADRYEAKELVEATFQSGVKIRGRRSVGPVLSSLKPLREFFGVSRLRTIKASDIQAYKNHRLDTPVEILVTEKVIIIDSKTSEGSIKVNKVVQKHQRKIATVNRELQLLRAMPNYAIQNEWLVRNPFSLVKGIISKAAEVERHRVLSFEEEERLLDACVGRREHLRPLLVCALDTAMRRGEIFKMKWREVDLAANEIRIPQTNTKTEEARTVGITPRLKNELEVLWKRSSKSPETTVFGINNTVKNAFKTACEEANIEDFRFHDCRHTATTRMVASGSPHTEVMKITGHSQLTTFLRYLNITSETTNKVAARLGVYIGQNKSLETIDTSDLIHDCGHPSS